MYVPCLGAGFAAPPALSHGHRILFHTVLFQPTENQFMHQSNHTAAVRACLKLLEQICDPYAWDSQCSITVLVNESGLLCIG